MRTTILATLVALLPVPPPAVPAAPGRAPAAEPLPAPDTVVRRTADAVALALVGGAAGFFAGGWLGYSAEVGDGGEFDGLLGFLLGAFVGEPPGVAAGAWLGDGRSGAFGKALLAATLTEVGGLFALGAASSEEAMWVGIPLAAALQVSFTVGSLRGEGPLGLRRRGEGARIEVRSAPAVGPREAEGTPRDRWPRAPAPRLPALGHRRAGGGAGPR